MLGVYIPWGDEGRFLEDVKREGNTEGNEEGNRRMNKIVNAFMLEWLSGE